MEAFFDDIEDHIINELRSATERILVAAAWFTNQRLGQVLIERRCKYIDVEVLVDDNLANRKSSALKMLSNGTVSVSFVKNLGADRALMHNKFAVIDNQRVITGSYNWTVNANANDENIFIFTDDLNATYYIHEFRRLLHLNDSRHRLFITEIEHNGIVNDLMDEFKSILKNSVESSSYKQDSLYNFTSYQLVNRVRSIKEELTINAKQVAGTFTIYKDLIGMYGKDFQRKASRKEVVMSRDKFRKEGLKEYQAEVDTIFSRMKFRALHLILCQYLALLKSKKKEEDVERILNVYQFILNERNKLGRDLGITVL